MARSSATWLVFTALLYGLIGVFVKYIGNAIPVISIVFLRFFFGLLLLALIVPFIDPAAFRNFRKDLWHYAFMGFLLAASVGTYTAALHFSTVSMVTIVWSAYIFSTAILAYFILNEHLTLRCMLAMLIGFGCMVVLNPLGGGNAFGNGITLVSAFMYSLMLVLMRKDERTHTPGTVFWMVLFAALYLLPFPFIVGFGQLSGMPLLWVALLGFICTGTAYLTLDFGLKKVDADTASMIILVVSTLSSLMLAIWLLDEPFTIRMGIGGTLLIGSGIIMELKRFRARHAHHR